MLRLERVVHMTIGVYKITNKINGKVYVGASTDLQQRKIDHFKPSTLKGGRGKLPLYQDIKQYGKENFDFEIIEYCTKDDLKNREEFYLLELKDLDHYNVVYTAHNTDDENFKKEHSKRLTNRNLENWQDPEYRNKMTNVLKGQANKSAFFKRFNKERWDNPDSRAEMEKLLEENRLKIAADPENSEKAIKGLNKYTDSIKLPVGQYDKQWNLIQTFEGVREAERTLGLPNDSVGKICRGVKYRKSAGGFYWKYLEE